MRRHGFLAVLFAGVAASAAWLMNQQHTLNASEDDARSFREAFSGTDPVADAVEQQDGVRLNYFDTRWDRVLKDLASQAELTLVMDRIPHGSFARRDRTRYQIDSAVRIVNAELEAQGFRLIKQGNFLVVLKLDQARTRYSRPVLNEWTAAEAAAHQSRQAASPFQQISSRRTDETNPRVTWSQDGQPAGRNASEQPFQTQVAPQPPAPPQAKDPGPATTVKVGVKNRKAAEIARSIYLVFESRASLVKNGLNSLPTFVVRETEQTIEGEKPLFQIGIDQATNSLILDGPQSRVDNLKRLVAQLDRVPANNEETTRLVPKNNVNDKTAQALNAQIKRMMTMKARQAGDENPLAAQANDDQDVDTSLNLRGPVDVQVMDDVGVMMLSGNDADVRKVEAIIKQLEELSEGSLPGIHLLELQHVNSEAMAELMSSVYEELSELRQRGNTERKTATFFPVVQPNAILILASEIELTAVLELANKLDRTTDPNSEFKAFNLQNAIASQVATAVEAFYSERGGLAVRPRVVADARTNTIIVQGRGNDLAEVERLIESLDKDEPSSVHRVEIIPLNHATAAELSELISTAIQSVSSPPQQTTGQGAGGGGFGGNNQGAQELQDSKSVALEFLSTTGAGRELIRSGILIDVRVNADPRSNSLILSAPEASLPLVKALIAELDKSPAAVAEIKVFALKNSDAEQTVELLTGLFEDQNQEDQLGIQIAGAADAATSLIPVKFSADLRTNTILAVGSVEALSVVEAILLRLDSTEGRARDTTVIPMRNVQASVVADALDAFLEQQADLQESADGLVSNIERLRQEVLVTADDNSNSLIVSATPEYYSQITGIISELDATPPQVIIQALLVEVQLDNTDEFGVELGFQDPTLFSRSLIETVTGTTSTSVGTPGYNFNNTGSGLGNSSLSESSTIGTQGISNFSLGRQNSDLGFGGFVFSAQSDAVSVLVRALAARRTVHVLSRPQIRAMNNQPASIQVGQQVPVVNGVTQGNNFVTPNIEQQDVGIILQVTPRVTQDGTINMDVYAEKSSLSSGGVPVFSDAATGNVIESVIIDSAIADTVVSVPNGQTIVIGGMITKSDETLERKVPWLGDLPVLGNLFRYDATNTARSELLIFLTPRIIYGDADSELIKQVEAERMHFIESEAEEMHGPLYSVPPSGLDQPSMFHEGPPSDADFMLYGAPGQQPDYPNGQPVPQTNEVLPPQASTDRRSAAGDQTAALMRQSNIRQASATQTEAERKAAAAWVQRAVDSSERKTDSVQQMSAKSSPSIQSQQDLYEPPKRKWYQKMLKGGSNDN